MDKKLVEKLKGLLEQEKGAIEKELATFAAKDKNTKYNWDAKYPGRENGTAEEEADESQEYDNLLSLEQSLEVKLKEVILALEKIQAGTYGVCTKCGKGIEEERLIAYPEAKLCIKCNAIA